MKGCYVLTLNTDSMKSHRRVTAVDHASTPCRKSLKSKSKLGSSSTTPNVIGPIYISHLYWTFLHLVGRIASQL